ncbi:MAG TPA: BON domain-containing protein [Candidatus Angelobacter sp.]
MNPGKPEPLNFGLRWLLRFFPPARRIQEQEEFCSVRKALSVFVYLCALLAPATLSAGSAKTYSPKAQARITREVRHKLLMLADFGVFDNIAFKLNGYDVMLLGQVTRPMLKSDAERVVKKIEGVERVENRIQVLPLSSFDDRLRRDLFRAIYGFAPLQHYGVGSNRPIHIIVDRGHVTLEGVVDRQADKDMAGLRANGVFGVFSVQNNLVVPAKTR